MSHRNARLTPRGRQLLVERFRDQGMPVAHVARAMGISRQCAHRWVRRFDQKDRPDSRIARGEEADFVANNQTPSKPAPAVNWLTWKAVPDELLRAMLGAGS